MTFSGLNKQKHLFGFKLWEVQCALNKRSLFSSDNEITLFAKKSAQKEKQAIRALRLYLLCVLCVCPTADGKCRFDLRCEALGSLPGQRSYPPSPGRRPSGACWSRWPAGLPSCWDGHLAATCMWSARHPARICMLFPLEKTRKEAERWLRGGLYGIWTRRTISQG